MIFSKKNNLIYEYVILRIGTFLMAFAIKNLYAPVNLVTGGVSGVSIILHSKFNVPLWLSNIALNVPLFLIAIPTLGWKFVARTLVATFTLSFALYIIPEMVLVSNDMFLSSLFGGILTGVGIGMVFMVKGTTGGTDLFAALLHLKIKRFSLIEILQVVDIIIVIAGITVFGISQALYALVAIFVITKISDNIVEGVNFSKQAFIISDHSESIAQAIMQQMDRGVTAITAKGMYSGTEKRMLFCVIAQKEVVALRELVNSIDQKAFITLSDSREVFGEGFIEK